MLAQLANLRTHPVVQKALAAGTLRLHGWVAQQQTGKVFEYVQGEQRFCERREQNAYQ